METWIRDLKERRIAYGLSQSRLAVTAGITRVYLNQIENGRRAKVSGNVKDNLLEALEKLRPDAPLEMVIDYVRIRFPIMDVKYVVSDILRLKQEYMLHEDYGFYSYSEHYVMGDIFVLISPDEEKGVLLELKGRGCRQFENYLFAQGRDWYEFFRECLKEDAVIKRLDLAINDKTGLLDIPELSNKCKNEECISVFRTFKDYESGELVKSREQHKAEMGKTLYIGSLKSEVYFCIYEKDYEQYIKHNIPIEDAEVKNRFEIRLKNDRAFHAMYDLLSYRDAERTAFSIINRYVRFVDKDEDKRRSEWRLNAKWSWFIGENREKLKLTTKPEPFTYERTLKWLSHQVMPTQKMLKEVDSKNGTDFIGDMLKNAKLTEKHEKLIKQMTTPTEMMVTEGVDG